MIGPKAQFGLGANGKNLNLGLSNWQAMILTVQSNSWDNQLDWDYTGDVNIDVASIPEPSSAVLFAIGGLVVGASIRRHR